MNEFWYSNLSPEDFIGKYFIVYMINGSIFLCVKCLASEKVVAMDLCGESRNILERDSVNEPWHKSCGVESISEYNCTLRRYVSNDYESCR